MTQLSNRNISLDVFRGMTVCFMIIVNTPGDWSFMYAPLEHASWHGFTPTDLVFPSFLFAVGNAMAFVFAKNEIQNNSVFLFKVFKRSVLIFLIGFLLYWFPFIEWSGDSMQLKSLSDTRIPGVLQRIALCYFFASLMIHFLSEKTVLITSVFMLFLYWFLLVFFGDVSDPLSLSGNAVLKLDVFLFGESHLYHGEGIAFDPEGLLSTIPSIVNVVAGYFAGNFIRKKGNSYELISTLMVTGSILIVIALFWHLAFPINKKLWTSSFVLLTSGIDLILISILVYFIELKQKKTFVYFFTVFGKNPLVIYVLSGMLISLFYIFPTHANSLHHLLFHDLFSSFLDPYGASFCFALVYMLFCWVFGYVLDKRKIYIKL